MSLFSKLKPAKSADIDTQMVDRRRDALYDRVQLRAGEFMPTVFNLFRTPVGIADPFCLGRVKFFADTNMWMPCQLPTPHDMVIQNFLLLFQPTTATVDRDRFVAQYFWQFQIMNKIFVQQPGIVAAAEGDIVTVMENFGKGSWLDDNSPRENDSTSVISRVGKCFAWRLGEQAHYLPPLVQFRFGFEGTPFQLQSDFDMYVMLDGLRDYPVQ